MQVTTNLNEGFLPDRYTKHAQPEEMSDGYPNISFPFTVSDLPAGTHYLAWTLVDFDSVPVAGFVWIHWLAANYPVHDTTVTIPENLAQTGRNQNFIPGSNSLYSHFVSEDRTEYIQGYEGPMPPNQDHDYTLTVYALRQSVDLPAGFFLNQLRHALQTPGLVLGQASIELPVRK
ncbi:YbhB/YbcL family Raf kinase inhibitor-like protein [Leuconostocaceae bacterium ESL0723]|nr:YbhB/YbcL family Raf kinase inhibitor-like protein [Leuconostocaceae bacterium ESL0723]